MSQRECTVLLPRLFRRYACDTWSLHVSDLKGWHHFTTIVHEEYRVKWSDRISNMEVRNRCYTISMSTRIQWFGHSLKMNSFCNYYHKMRAWLMRSFGRSGEYQDHRNQASYWITRPACSLQNLALYLLQVEFNLCQLKFWFDKPDSNLVKVNSRNGAIGQGTNFLIWPKKCAH